MRCCSSGGRLDRALHAARAARALLRVVHDADERVHLRPVRLRRDFDRERVAPAGV